MLLVLCCSFCCSARSAILPRKMFRFGVLGGKMFRFGVPFPSTRNGIHWKDRPAKYVRHTLSGYTQKRQSVRTDRTTNFRPLSGYTQRGNQYVKHRTTNFRKKKQQYGKRQTKCRVPLAITDAPKPAPGENTMNNRELCTAAAVDVQIDVQTCSKHSVNGNCERDTAVPYIT